MKSIDVENAILSSFLFLNECSTDEDIQNNMFKLDERIFTNKFRKRVCKLINEVNDDCYGFLCHNLENKSVSTPYAIDWLDIMKQTSMGLVMAKKYHDQLLYDFKIKEIL